MEVELIIVISTDDESLYKTVKSMIKNATTTLPNIAIKYTNDPKKTDFIFKNLVFITASELNQKYFTNEFIPIIVKSKDLEYDEDDEKYTSKNELFKQLESPIIINKDVFPIIYKIWNEKENDNMDSVTSEEYSTLAREMDMKKSELKEKLENKKFITGLYKNSGLLKLIESIEENFSSKKQKQIMRKYVIEYFAKLPINDLKACSQFMTLIDEMSYFKEANRTEIFAEIEIIITNKVSEMDLENLKKWKDLSTTRSFNKLQDKLQVEINNLTLKDREKIIKDIQNIVDLNQLIKIITNAHDKDIIMLAILDLKNVYNEQKNTNDEWLMFLNNLDQLKIDKAIRTKIIIKIIKSRIEGFQRIVGKGEEKNIYFFCLHAFLMQHMNDSFEFVKLMMIMTKYLNLSRINNFDSIVDNLSEDEYKKILALEFKMLTYC